MIQIQARPFNISAISISEDEFILESIIPNEINNHKKFRAELDKALSEIAEEYKTTFFKYKSAFLFGPSKYKNQQLQRIIRTIIVFSDISLPEDLDDIFNKKLPAEEWNYMEISIICNLETNRISVYGPSTRHSNTRCRTLIKLIESFCTKLTNDSNMIKYTIDGDECQFVPKPPIDSEKKNIDWLSSQYNKSISLFKYDGTRIIVVCEENEDGEPEIKCYTRHCFPINGVDLRIEEVCCRIRLVSKSIFDGLYMPFILEMEAYHEDYNSSKCSALVKEGSIDRLRLAVFNYIPLMVPDCEYQNRFEILEEVDKARINGIFRAEQYDTSSFSDFMKASREKSENESYIEGAVLWNCDEMASRRGRLIKVKYRQVLVMNVNGITIHKNKKGINLSCSGEIDGIKITSEVPLHGDKNAREQLIKIYNESEEKALSCIGPTIEVTHFGLEVNTIRHPYARIV